jgi:D-sedoheptulose 7-phosphate isomerase
LGLSTSGNSANVLNALRVGRALGLRTLGFSGGAGGAMPGLCAVLVCVPADVTSEVQELHQALYHALCAQLEERFFWAMTVQVPRIINGTIG